MSGTARRPRSRSALERQGAADAARAATPPAWALNVPEGLLTGPGWLRRWERAGLPRLSWLDLAAVRRARGITD